MKSITFLPVLLIFAFSSCGSKENKERNSEADDLFNKSVQTIIESTLKIKNASDSIEVDSISEAFEKRIIEINFSVSAETDLKLNEQENDSLYKLLNNFRNLKEEKLRELSISHNDTIPEEPLL